MTDEERRKKLLQVKLRKEFVRARRSREYWQMVKEQSDGWIAKYNQRITELQSRVARLEHEKSIAPARFESADKEVKRLAALIKEEPKKDPILAKVNKLKVLLEKTKEMERELAEINITPEQIEMLKRAASLEE